jgi:hypothetical protein
VRRKYPSRSNLKKQLQGFVRRVVKIELAALDKPKKSFSAVSTSVGFDQHQRENSFKNILSVRMLDISTFAISTLLAHYFSHY